MQPRPHPSIWAAVAAQFLLPAALARKLMQEAPIPYEPTHRLH